MTPCKHHPANERIKRRYLIYLREAKRLSEASVDQAASAIAAFEGSTGYRDFCRFHIEQAKKFKRVLSEEVSKSTGRPLAKATIYSRLMAVKAFFVWLADQPKYRPRIGYADTEYFNPSANDTRIAKAVREQPVPTIEQIRHVLKTMPGVTPVERRNRAIIACTLLTGMRDNAIASLSLKHVDLSRRKVFQDAREVRTKGAKTFTSSFFPVGNEIERIFVEYVAWLRSDQLFCDSDPLFPATRVALNVNRQFEAIGLDRRHWRSAASIRKIFREAFEMADLPYYNPHSFRKTLATLGQRLCRTPEEYKAWSQNLGHEGVLTTFTSYGTVPADRQAGIMEELRSMSGPTQSTNEIRQAMQKFLELTR